MNANRALDVLVWVAFLLLSMAVMAPVIPRMMTVMYGLPGDPYFTIWKLWNFKQASMQGTPLYMTEFIGAPFLTDLRFVPYYLLWDKLHFIIMLATNEVFAYNLSILFGFVLSGAAMYYLVRYVTGNRAASFYSGLAYMLCPYHLARSVGHLTLASIQWLPLFVLSVLMFLDKRSRKGAVWVGLMLAVVCACNYYYGLFSFIVLFVMFGAALFKRSVTVDRAFVAQVLIMTTVACVSIAFIVAPVFMSTIKPVLDDAPATMVYASPTKALFAGSARPLSYLLPSYMHPLFGNFTRQFIGSVLYGESKGENALYLGIVPILLAWTAVRRERRVSRMFLLLFWTSIICSMPPYVKLFSVIIPLPQYFIYKAAPIFRTFARFGVYAMLALSVLAGIGLKQQLSRKTASGKVLLYAAVVAILVFEFLVNPFSYATDLGATPAAYQWLADQSENFIIAEYPINKNELIRADRLIWQRAHRKRKIDGAFPGSQAAFYKRRIARLQDRHTPGILRWLGVRYVLVHRDEMMKSETLDVVGELPDFGRQNGLTFIKRFGDIDVYSVTAQPALPRDLAGEAERRNL